MQISPPQMSCQAFGNTQQLDLHFFQQPAQAKPPGNDHSRPKSQMGKQSDLKTVGKSTNARSVQRSGTAN
jgi:hypothetical protein